MTMKTRLVTSFFLLGALLAPLAGYTEDSDKDRASPKAFIKDSVITAKVKAEMAKDREVSALHIKVDTDNKGVVQLSGTAKSQAEAEKAVQIANGVKGVTAVENKIVVASDR
jgi:hyperosmotically inducible protein